MTTFRWLHLTDLHFGMHDQASLWPNMEEIFLQDLDFLRKQVGSGIWSFSTEISPRVAESPSSMNSTSCCGGFGTDLKSGDSPRNFKSASTSSAPSIRPPGAPKHCWQVSGDRDFALAPSGRARAKGKKEKAEDNSHTVGQ